VLAPEVQLVAALHAEVLGAVQERFVERRAFIRPAEGRGGPGWGRAQVVALLREGTRAGHGLAEQIQFVVTHAKPRGSPDRGRRGGCLGGRGRV
jgi:hypothetical protein